MEPGKTEAPDSDPRQGQGGSRAAADDTVKSGGIIRGPADLAGGIFLLLVALAAWWYAQPLKVGTAYRMGPGFVPMLIYWALGGFGVVLCVIGLVKRGPGLGRWPLGRIALIVGSLVAFALAIERTGLLISSMLVVVLAGMAARGASVRQVLILAAALAAFACLLFPLVLNLPVKVLP